MKLLTAGLVGLLTLAPAHAVRAEVQFQVAGPTSPPECSDGADNDADGLVDFPDDAGCYSEQDPEEAEPSPHTDNEWETSVTIRRSVRDGSSLFSGKVLSERGRCIYRRVVVVKRRRSGADQFIGRDLSGRYGRWRVRSGHIKGRFYALAKEKSFLDAQGNRHTCLADRSITIE